MLPIKLELSEEFFKEENRNGFIVKSETKRLWAIILDLLREFMNVCDRNGIKYYACGGTLLGATRHKGMIPWDDDIDVMMFREEYEKLCRIAVSEFRHPYFFQTQYTDNGSLRGHAQLRNSETTGILENEKGLFSFNQGVFLDIFPLDNVPDDNGDLDNYLQKIAEKRDEMILIRSYSMPYEIHIKDKSVKMMIKDCLSHYLHAWNIIHTKDLNQVYGEFENIMKSHNESETKRIILSPLCNKRNMWHKKDFEGKAKYLPFEMFEIPVPCNYLEILRQMYGNWQEYVIGTSLHGKLIFDVEQSYKLCLSKLRCEHKKERRKRILHKLFVKK